MNDKIKEFIANCRMLITILSASTIATITAVFRAQEENPFLNLGIMVSIIFLVIILMLLIVVFYKIKDLK